jgi:hypothetical protein
MNLKELEGKSLSLIVWNIQKDDDVNVYLGRFQMANGEIYFVNKEKGWRVSLDEEQLNRLKPVSDDLKETLLGADYALSMSMDDLPEMGTEEFKATGMNWHE